MAKEKISYEDFLATVDAACKPFVENLHQMLLKSGCTLVVKEAKSGYVVSYLLDKKTLMNYVFRKKGLVIRMYTGNVNQYMEFLEELPAGMIKEMQKAPVCKRLINPEACNPKCAMGYDYILQGERQQKCRNNAFMFLLDEENKPFIEAWIEKELCALGKRSI